MDARNECKNGKSEKLKDRIKGNRKGGQGMKEGQRKLRKREKIN